MHGGPDARFARKSVSTDPDGLGCADLYTLGFSAAKVAVVSLIVKHGKRVEGTSVRSVPLPDEPFSFPIFLGLLS
jgi:hypothetical protein